MQLLKRCIARKIREGRLKAHTDRTESFMIHALYIQLVFYHSVSVTKLYFKENKSLCQENSETGQGEGVKYLVSNALESSAVCLCLCLYLFLSLFVCLSLSLSLGRYLQRQKCHQISKKVSNKCIFMRIAGDKLFLRSTALIIWLLWSSVCVSVRLRGKN